jgi:hypothetical protein
VPHQSVFDEPDSAPWGVALIYHNPPDGVLIETFEPCAQLCYYSVKLECLNLITGMCDANR